MFVEELETENKSDVVEVSTEIVSHAESYIPDILDDTAPARIVYDPKYTIAMGNTLIKGRLAMSGRESKIYRLLVSQVQPADDGFKVFQISLNTLAQIVGIKSQSSFRRDIQKIVSNLLTQTVWVFKGGDSWEAQNNWKAFPLLDICETDGPYIRFRLSQHLKPYLLQLTGDYTQYPTYLLNGFSSTYAIRIYELLQMAYTRTYKKYRQFRFGVDRLRYILQPSTVKNKKGFYPEYANFKARVLDSAVKQINENLLTDFTVTYAEDKEGTNRVQSIIFTLKRREYWDDYSKLTPEAIEAMKNAAKLQERINKASAIDAQLSEYTADEETYMIINDSGNVPTFDLVSKLTTLLGKPAPKKETLSIESKPVAEEKQEVTVTENGNVIDVFSNVSTNEKRKVHKKKQQKEQVADTKGTVTGNTTKKPTKRTVKKAFEPTESDKEIDAIIDALPVEELPSQLSLFN